MENRHGANGNVGAAQVAQSPADGYTLVNATINASLADPAFRKRLGALGYDPLGGTSEQFASYMAQEIKSWSEVVKFSGAKID